MPLSRKKIRTLIQPGLVLDLPPLPKQEALAQLCKAMTADARVLDGEALLQAVLQREEMSSTGIGLGLAIPHVKIPQVTDFILAIGRCREGLEFGALDGQPVHLIFMLAASDQQTRPFIRVLAKIAEVMREDGARRALLEAQNPEFIVKLCKQYEW